MTTTDRPTMPPITCQPWCSDGEGHADARYAEDQVCFSDALTSEFAGVYPADMAARARRAGRSAPPTVRPSAGIRSS
jgi:hypothetical protein